MFGAIYVEVKFNEIGITLALGYEKTYNHYGFNLSKVRVYSIFKIYF